MNCVKMTEKTIFIVTSVDFGNVQKIGSIVACNLVTDWLEHKSTTRVTPEAPSVTSVTTDWSRVERTLADTDSGLTGMDEREKWLK